MISVSDTFITNDTRPESPYRQLLDLIPVGRENAIPIRDLASVMNLEPRQLYRQIEYARISGNIIAGTGDGLFVPDNWFDVEEYVNRSQARIMTSIETLNPSYKLLRNEKLLLVHIKEDDHDD